MVSDKWLHKTTWLGYSHCMDARLPDFLRPPAYSQDLEQTHQKKPRGLDVALSSAEFESYLPRILGRICEGSTLAQAIRELPVVVDPGAFYRWLKKNQKFHALYVEAKEIRTEEWAGRIIAHAEGEAGAENDTARSKLIIDTYKWLMSADNRKTYGESKHIEVTQSISITGALEAARGRVSQVIDLNDDDFEVIEPSDYKQLSSGEDEDED